MYMVMTVNGVEHVFRELSDGGMQSFPDIDGNLGPERRAYLSWVAEGNEPETVKGDTA